MSSADSQEKPEQQAGGLGELIPEPLMPVWKRIEKIQSFRRTYGEWYINALELLTGLVLTGGYIWWMLVFLDVV